MGDVVEFLVDREDNPPKRLQKGILTEIRNPHSLHLEGVCWECYTISAPDGFTYFRYIMEVRTLREDEVFLFWLENAGWNPQPY